METELGKDQKKLAKLQQSLVALQDRLKKDQDTISETKLEELGTQFKTEIRQYEQLNAQLNQKRLKLEEDFIKQSEPITVKSIEAISKERGYHIILDRQAALFVAEAFDLTEVLKQKLNQ